MGDLGDLVMVAEGIFFEGMEKHVRMWKDIGWINSVI